MTLRLTEFYDTDIKPIHLITVQPTFKYSRKDILKQYELFFKAFWNWLPLWKIKILRHKEVRQVLKVKLENLNRVQVKTYTALKYLKPKRILSFTYLEYGDDFIYNTKGTVHERNS